MSKETAIQWCDSTINPVMGCSGCELWTDERHTCYAGQLHLRRTTSKGFAPDFLTPKLFPGRMAEAAKWSDLSGSKRQDKPWLDGLPRLIFVSDMGDALSEKDAIDNNNEPVEDGAVPFSFLKTEIIDTARSENGSRHQWLWLTKRPNRLVKFDRWLNEQHGLVIPQNIWVGASITGPKTLNRAEQLRKVGGKKTIRFLSVEPLWEAVTLADRLTGISWVIVGGESSQGVQAEEFKVEWAEQLRDECRSANVAFFLKQLGSQPTRNGDRLKLPDRHGGDWSYWPQNLRVRQMPSIPTENGLEGNEFEPDHMQQVVCDERTAVTAEAYQAFILQVVREHDGIIADDALDQIIEERYRRHWSATDRMPWGSVKNKPKWRQNVASAKSGLDRTGQVIGFNVNGTVFRVLIDERARTAIAAYLQQQHRGRRRKPSHQPLEQPQPMFIVPETKGKA